tara:strand:- start:48 stop:689 length:642 start_codon:yes stop_codon:yes gene_type:complete
MNSRLWTYGCSFTQGMWQFDVNGDKTSEKNYPGHGHNKNYIWGSEKNWVDILGEKLEAKIENRALEGSGIIEVFNAMMKDTYDWRTDDYIIIQLPLLVRQFDILELKRYQNDDRKAQEMMKRWSEGIFHLMDKTNLQWFWWLTESPEHMMISDVCSDNRLIFPSNIANYKDWMFSDHTLFYDSYAGEHCVDYHQNRDAHIRMAEFFYKQIRNR